MYALRCTCIGLVISLLWVAYIYIVLVVIRNHSFGSVILGAIANSAEPFRGLVTRATVKKTVKRTLYVRKAGARKLLISKELPISKNGDGV